MELDPEDCQAQLNDHSCNSDSHDIGIDDHASCSLTNLMKDFIDEPTQIEV